MAEEDIMQDDEDMEKPLNIQPVQIEEHNIEDSQLEYVEKSAETVYHWFYPNNVSQTRAADIANETFGISNPEVYEEDMFESITIIIDYIDSKDLEERHEALMSRC